MERFVIGAAIFAAVAIAAGSYFGHAVSDKDGFRFEINTDDDTSGGQGTGAPSSAASKTFAATALSIRNAVAVLKVIPEDRADISIEITNPGRLTTPTVRTDDDRVVISGGISGNRIRDCSGAQGSLSVSVRGVGEVSAAEMPVITARVPRDVKLSVSGAVDTSVGPGGGAELEFAGCGNALVGDITGKLEVESSGSGDVQAGTAASVSISSAGSGNVTVGAVAGDMEVSLAGSGGATLAAANGALDISIAGSGDVTVNGGVMKDADISIAGSGDVSVKGPVQALSVSIAGSGDVDVSAATNVDSSILGSGDVRVAVVSGRLDSDIMGSGTVTTGSPAQPLKPD